MQSLTEFPYYLNKKQRIQFFSASFLLDSILINYSQAEECVNKHSHSQGDEFSMMDRAALFRWVWAIVESASGLYGVMETSREFFCKIKQYPLLIPHLKKAVLLRNQKVHVRGNLNNIVKSRVLEPLHGIVSWRHSIEIDEHEERIYIQHVALEPLTHELKLNTSDFLKDVRYGRSIDDIRLSAFGKNLNLTRFVDRLREYVTGMDLELRKIASSDQTKGATLMASVPEIERVPINGIVLARKARS